MNAKNFNLFKLSNWGAIKVSGSDSSEFLQNLITISVNDVNKFIRTQSCNLTLASLCNAKGRVLSTFQLVKIEESSGDAYIFFLSKDLIADLVKELKKYVFRSKVAISMLDDEYDTAAIRSDTDIHIINDDIINQMLVVAEMIPHSTSPVKDESYRFFISLISKKNQSINYQASNDDFDIYEIRSGIPRLTKPTSLMLVPQMINLDVLHGINFKKGCYPGQEIVARTQYLGSIKRRMFVVESNGALTCNPGEELLDSEGNVIGLVLLAHFDKKNGRQFAQIELLLSKVNEKIYLKKIDQLTELCINFVSQMKFEQS